MRGAHFLTTEAGNASFFTDFGFLRLDLDNVLGAGLRAAPTADALFNHNGWERALTAKEVME